MLLENVSIRVWSLRAKRPIFLLHTHAQRCTVCTELPGTSLQNTRPGQDDRTSTDKQRSETKHQRQRLPHTQSGFRQPVRPTDAPGNQTTPSNLAAVVVACLQAQQCRLALRRTATGGPRCRRRSSEAMCGSNSTSSVPDSVYERRTRRWRRRNDVGTTSRRLPASACSQHGCRTGGILRQTGEGLAGWASRQRSPL